MTNRETLGIIKKIKWVFLEKCVENAYLKHVFKSKHVLKEPYISIVIGNLKQFFSTIV